MIIFKIILTLNKFYLYLQGIYVWLAEISQFQAKRINTYHITKFGDGTQRSENMKPYINLMTQSNLFYLILCRFLFIYPYLHPYNMCLHLIPNIF